MEEKKLNVEGNEIAIFSSKGVMAIIPRNKVSWVKQKLADGCHECIDQYVSKLKEFE
jgi:hypothetical protein